MIKQRLPRKLKKKLKKTRAYWINKLPITKIINYLTGTQKNFPLTEWQKDYGKNIDTIVKGLY
jgi:hypothetical protein